MTIISRATKVELEGRGSLTLRKNDFVAQGGEGAIYRKGQHVVKLYTDRKRIIADNMPGKIKLLASTLRHPSIVSPKGLVADSKGTPIGYYMEYADGEPLSRVFTNDFRNQEGFGDAHALKLVRSMHEVVDYVHQQKALMVDGNELNWRANVKQKDAPLPLAIDVDAWAIGTWPATVIMPSIRDWHSKTFGPLTDWFAWGIVSFQVFTGIHPYKGKLDGYKPGELERRMKDNASVFQKAVRLNHAVRDFSVIPGNLLEWYQETFETTSRTPPPVPGEIVPLKGGRKILRATTTHTGGLRYEMLFRTGGDEIRSIWPCGVMRTDSGALYELGSKSRIGTSKADRLAVVEEGDWWLLAEYQNNTWRFRAIHQSTREDVQLECSVLFRSVFRSGNRLFIITETEVVEMKLRSFSKPILTTGNHWGIMGNATVWYREIGISDIFGKTYAVLPVEDTGLVSVHLPELDDSNLKVLSAVAGNRYVETVVLDASGNLEVLGFSFNSAYNSYTVTKRSVDQPELNTVILPKGVAARVENDGELVVFVPRQNEEKIVNDKDLFTNHRLARFDDTVVYAKGDEVWSLKMR